MPTPIFEFIPTIFPVRDGYQFAPADEAVVVKVDGGASRTRKDKIGGSQYVTVTWILNSSQYNHTMGFFREVTFNGTSPFRVQLLTDAGVVVPHVCICPDGPPRLVRQSGDAYWVQSALEVTPNPIRSWGLRLDNAVTPTVADNGLGVLAGDLTEFPVGRDILLANTTGTASGVTINLDGTYEINGAPSSVARTLLNAAAVNPQWTTLNGTAAQIYSPTNRQGVMILLPE